MKSWVECGIFLLFNVQILKKVYFCRWKSIGEQSVSDVHNLAMTLRRANLSISFFISVLQ